MAICAKGRRGKYFPYQEEADAMFNSALIYELAVLKQYVEPLLLEFQRIVRNIQKQSDFLNSWIIYRGQQRGYTEKLYFKGIYRRKLSGCVG